MVSVLLRLVGMMFTLVGLGFVVSAIEYWRRPIVAQGVATVSGSASVDAIVAASVTLILGVSMLLVMKPYRPDLHLPRTGAQRRSWWTGESHGDNMCDREHRV
jgi:hypothetical protein